MKTPKFTPGTKVELKEDIHTYVPKRGCVDTDKPGYSRELLATAGTNGIISSTTIVGDNIYYDVPNIPYGTFEAGTSESFLTLVK
jgi:hypothetical protein